jgi:hypothetical protein
MKAIGYTQSVAMSNPESLIDVTFAQPIATGRDLHQDNANPAHFMFLGFK